MGPSYHRTLNDEGRLFGGHMSATLVGAVSYGPIPYTFLSGAVRSITEE